MKVTHFNWRYISLALLTFCLPSALATTPHFATSPNSGSSYLIDANGTLLSWGNNSSGILGIGSSITQPTPTGSPFPTGVQRWKVIAAGFSSALCSIAIADNGGLYGAGGINVAPYGFLDHPNYLSLIPDAEGTGWTDVAVGNGAWFALTGNGKLYGWQNGSKQYPPPPTGTHWTRVAISETEVLAISNDGRLYRKNINGFPAGFVEVSRPAGVTAWTNIATCGAPSGFAWGDDGNLYGWGENQVGQLGLGSFGTSISNSIPQVVTKPLGVLSWKAIACGWVHCLALGDDARVYAWGYNNNGQLGLGDTVDRNTPTVVPNLTNVTAVGAGTVHSLAVADCKVWSWGGNTVGQLGIGNAGSFQASPSLAVITYDICATNASDLPVVSIAGTDVGASETTFLNDPNTAAFRVSRQSAGDSPLVVKYSISGTASNGVDYLALADIMTIPSGSNSVTVLIVPIQDGLSEEPETIIVSLLPDPAYASGTTTNVFITLIDHQSSPPPPIPSLFLRTGITNSAQVFSLQASTNLIHWTQIGIVTNAGGTISISDPEASLYQSRYFRAVPLTNP